MNLLALLTPYARCYHATIRSGFGLSRLLRATPLVDHPTGVVRL